MEAGDYTGVGAGRRGDLYDWAYLAYAKQVARLVIQK
jgi:hypothetical protein